MAYNSISIKPYIKSHLELQREITLIELAPSPYFFCLKYLSCIYEHVCKVWWKSSNDFKILRKQNIMDGRTHGRCENSLPTTNKVCWGYKEFAPRGSEFLPIRAVPCVMINHFYYIGWLPLNVTIFITHMRNCVMGATPMDLDITVILWLPNCFTMACSPTTLTHCILSDFSQGWDCPFNIFKAGFKLGQDSRDKWLLLPGKLGRSDSQIGRSYRAKVWHFLSI